MTHGSLFSGIGGFEIASEWMGWDNTFHCEINNNCQNLLKKYYPYSELIEDVRTNYFSKYRNRIDVLSGGDPCQPSSFAGKQLGTNDERYLWPEMFRTIKTIQPVWVVNENVEGTVNNSILDTKISDLESESYSCWPPIIMPANAYGALHRRNRVWLVAHSERNKQRREESCSREVRRMGRIFKPLPWHSDWESALHFLRGVDDGVSNILHRTDGTRNAIVPKVAYQIFKAIEAYEQL